MTTRIDDVAKKLGAEVVGTVPDYSAGAFGVAMLARTLRERLEPGHGKRPGRPSNPNWHKRSKVPMAADTEERLEELARMLSDDRRKVSPMQVAAQILEEGASSYFAQSGQPRRSPRRPTSMDPHGAPSTSGGPAPSPARFHELAQSGLLAEIEVWRHQAAAMREPVFPLASTA